VFGSLIKGVLGSVASVATLGQNKAVLDYTGKAFGSMFK
jgi:hypothetical protein